MARRITNKDVYAVAESIVRDSDVIRSIECHAGSSSYNRSWLFTFYLENDEYHYQHSFWNMSLLTAREAHTFLRGMSYMLELQSKHTPVVTEPEDSEPVQPICPECDIEFPADSLWCECGMRHPNADAMMLI